MSTDAMRAALDEAARSLETIAMKCGKDEFLSDLRDVAAYAGNRARIARAALAQPSVKCRAKQVGPDQWVCDCGGPPCTPPEQPSVPPASAERVPLTDEQIDGICERAWNEAETETAAHGTEADGWDWSPETEWTRYGEKIARAIERAHGITAEVAP